MAEVHDCFTPTELVLMEDLGFCERGTAWKEIQAGAFDLTGDLPVNPDGGLKSFGHPVGASGLRMMFEAWLQLRGEAPATARSPPPPTATSPSPTTSAATPARWSASSASWAPRRRSPDCDLLDPHWRTGSGKPRRRGHRTTVVVAAASAAHRGIAAQANALLDEPGVGPDSTIAARTAANAVMITANETSAATAPRGGRDGERPTRPRRCCTMRTPVAAR